MHVRRVVEVGEVVREEVETVAGHEPAADRGRIRVRRAAGATAHRERRAGLVGLEQPVEVEALRPVRGLRHPGQRREIPRAAAIARDVHRRGDEPGVVERLVHRRRARGEMLLVRT